METLVLGFTSGEANVLIWCLLGFFIVLNHSQLSSSLQFILAGEKSLLGNRALHSCFHEGKLSLIQKPYPL